MAEPCEGFSREHHGLLVNFRCVNTDQPGTDRSAAFENGSEARDVGRVRTVS
jgi:hypothetical protein